MVRIGHDGEVLGGKGRHVKILGVLGAITLEQFGLAVDPAVKRLVPGVQYGA